MTTIEIRMAANAPKDQIDEVVAQNARVHLEQMSQTEYTLIVDTGTERLCVSIRAANERSHIIATESWREAQQV